MFEIPQNDSGGPVSGTPRPHREYTLLPGISARAFEHPSDRAALASLRKIPGFAAVLRKLISFLGERSLRTIYLASAVRVTDRQFSRLDGLYRECMKILDVAERPELYVSQTPFVNAGAIGADKPFMVINSGLLSLLDEEEQRFILGHELGHILCDHVLYKTMLVMLLRLALGQIGIPLGSWALLAIIAGLLEWDRKSELSSDRAGLLCVQDPQVGYRVFMKLAGGSAIDQMDIGEFVRQAEDYRAGGTALDSVYKLLNLMGQRHPFHVLRLAEIKSWCEAGELDKILKGSYARRGDAEKPGVQEELAASVDTYKKDFQESPDPLIQFLRQFGAKAKEKGTEVLEKIRNSARKKDDT